MAGIYRSEVIFNMQHILSKICIRVRRGITLSSDSIIAVSIDSLKIGNFICQGDFNQVTDNSMTAEWTPIDTLPRYSITSAKHVSVPDSTVYLLESLLIPQPVSSEQYIRVWYKVGNPGGHMTRMDSKCNLNGLFGGFEPGKNYVITVILGPDPIRFDAGVQDWSNHYFGSN